MKSWMRFGLVALAAAAFATAPFACDKEGKAAKAGEKEGCSHAASMKADGATGCAHAEAAKADGATGCAHAKTAEAASYKDAAGGCPFHSKASETQRAALLKGDKVTLVGQILCASCDLKQAKSCKSVFRTEDGQTYAIIVNDAFEQLSGQTMHGEKKVEIDGTTAKDGAEPIVLMTSYKVVG